MKNPPDSVRKSPVRKKPVEARGVIGGATSQSGPVVVPDGATLDSMRALAADCRACDLWQRGTQTVFGEGAAWAKLLLAGEQPGDEEDRTGRPFVGPAGRLLDRALGEAGLRRSDVYVSNVVKHFKWEPRGKRRIHSKPSWNQVTACVPWLRAEIEVIKPNVIVCLGATAAQALLGKDFRVTLQRGVAVPSSLAPYVLATVHPSSLLRAPDEATRHREYARFVEDLRRASELLHNTARCPQPKP